MSRRRGRRRGRGRRRSSTPAVPFILLLWCLRCSALVLMGGVAPAALQHARRVGGGRGSGSGSGRSMSMCGVVAIRLADGAAPAATEIYDALTLLQHRGQDAAGIATASAGKIHICKNRGLVREVLVPSSIDDLPGQCGIGHVRYPTAGSNTANEAQPFFHNVPVGFALAHNGHITNAELLKDALSPHCHFNTESDSEVLAHLFGSELMEKGRTEEPLPPDVVFDVVRSFTARCRGGFAIVAVLSGQGLIAFRDPHGIRPLCFGSRTSVGTGKLDWAAASESVAFTALGFTLKRDLAPGEALYIDPNGSLHTRRYESDPPPRFAPCLFEWVYMARPDSVLDGVPVYDARAEMGRKLAVKVKSTGLAHQVDVVVPVPETSRISAMHLALSLGLPYEEGLIKNRYIGRTFIIPGQEARLQQVKKKLSPVQSVLRGKRILLVDDSIVRGTTSRQIIDMVRSSGAISVHFASMSPAIRYGNVYGIDLPRRSELVAFGLTEEQVAESIGADSVVYQDIDALEEAVRSFNPSLHSFENSIFTGDYVTMDGGDSIECFEEECDVMDSPPTKLAAHVAIDVI